MVCGGCGSEFSDEFRFCPQCGRAIDPLSAIRPTNVATGSREVDQSTPGNRIKPGTFLFVAFAAISLIVSVVNGVIPIYLFESVAWGAVAWYWQSRKTHSDTVKGIVFFVAGAVMIGEVIHVAMRFTVTRQPTQPFQSNSQSNAPLQPKLVPSCPSGIPSGVKITEIAPNQVTATNGQLWHVAPDYIGERGGWYFHFTVSNNTKDFCVTAVEYSVQLEPENGAVITGHGKKRLEPLSPGWSYTPHERDPDDRVTFVMAPSDGALSTWNVSKVYGFPQTNQ
jgi:hypothetical protein